MAKPVQVSLVIHRRWTEKYPDPKAAELHKASCRLFQSLTILYDLNVIDWGGADRENEVHEEIKPVFGINVDVDGGKVVEGMTELFKSLINRNKLQGVEIQVGKVKVKVGAASVAEMQKLLHEVKALQG